MEHILAFLLIAFNFLVFGLGAVFKFKKGFTTNQYSPFTIAWWLTCLLTLFSLWFHGVRGGLMYHVGMALGGVSLAVFCAALKTIWKEPFTLIFSSDTPSRLEFSGIYRFVRHPFYLSYILNYVAASFVSADFVVALSSLIMCYVYVRAAISEEQKFASSALASLYAKYTAETGRFFPYILR